MIHPTAEVEEGAVVREGTKIWHLCHVRKGAFVGRNCSLGRNVFIDSGVLIGDGVRIQNNVSIYNGVHIFDDVFIGPHVVFTNDLHPRAFSGDYWKKGTTIIWRGASLGAGTVVVCGNSIGRYAMTGAGTVVCRDIKPYELVVKFSKNVGKVDYDGQKINRPSLLSRLFNG